MSLTNNKERIQSEQSCGKTMCAPAVVVVVVVIVVVRACVCMSHVKDVGGIILLLALR